jgi:hypothetical protein
MGKVFQKQTETHVSRKRSFAGSAWYFFCAKQRLCNRRTRTIVVAGQSRLLDDEDLELSGSDESDDEDLTDPRSSDSDWSEIKSGKAGQILHSAVS